MSEKIEPALTPEEWALVLDDQLADEFAKLERAIAQRELEQRQAACPHANTRDVTVMGGPRRSLCSDCSLVLDAPATREQPSP